MNKTVISQMPPMGGDPMGGMGDPMGGMGDPMGGMGAPPGGAPPGTDRPSISGPLKSIGEILYDFNAEEYIALHPTENDDKIAVSIWEAYGGNADGSVDVGKIGERKEKDEQKLPEESQKELEDTEERKWERLPSGKNIGDVTSLDEIMGLVSSLAYGTIKKFRNPPAPAGGGMPPMASSHNSMEKLAQDLKKDLDKLRKYFK